MFVLKDFQTDPNRPWKNDVGSYAVGCGQRQDPRQSVFGSSENDKYNEPNAQNTHAHDKQSLQRAHHKCNRHWAGYSIT
jgi:hypothetical protein